MLLLLWPPNRAGHYIFILWFLSSIFFPRLISESQIGGLPYFCIKCGPSANLECRSETCCAGLTGNAGPKKSLKIRHLDTIAQLCRAISSQLRHVSTMGKNLLNSNSFTCPHIMNFGPLTAEIGWPVWVTPANSSGYRMLASLLRRRSTEVNQTLLDVWPPPGLVHYIYTVSQKKFQPLNCL